MSGSGMAATGSFGDFGADPEAGALALGAPYAVKVPVFEGPLDLLLHLIRLNEVEITDIPVARIAEQYLEYLEVMRELNLDRAGEYLLMAATLAWIKSRMLLPAEPEEELEGPDPRAELVARLLEYQRFKEAAGELGGRALLGRDVFGVRGAELETPPDAEREIEVDLFELIEAYRKALASPHHGGRAHEIEVEAVTVRDCMLRVMRLLEARASLDFEELLAEAEGRPGSALERVVAIFLAILELTRLSVLRLYQGLDELGVPRGPIHLRRAGEPGDRSWTERIADVM